MHAALEASLDKIVPQLMHRFSSSEGYKLFDDALPVRTSRAYRCHLACIPNAYHVNPVRQLQEMSIRTALISNSDARMRVFQRI